VRAVAVFNWIDAANKRYSKTIEKTFTGAGGDIVEKITVDDPSPKCAPLDVIKVAYGRSDRKPNPSGYTDRDYASDLVRSGDDVEMFMPFKGSIKLTDGFQADKIIDTGIYHTYVDMFFSTGTPVSYNNFSPEGGITSLFHISDDGQTIFWDFDPDWKTMKNIREFGAGTTTQFYATISFKCKDELSTNVCVVVEGPTFSTQPQPGLPSNAAVYELQAIYIQWGCFAKGTLITMADGSKKTVEVLESGQLVKTETGSSAIKNVITGKEEKLIVISTESGKTTRLTKAHPVKTARGLIPAERLNAADLVFT
jgi:hypothetical protein